MMLNLFQEESNLLIRRFYPDEPVYTLSTTSRLFKLARVFLIRWPWVQVPYGPPNK